jgi:hypothetical protein
MIDGVRLVKPLDWHLDATYTLISQLRRRQLGSEEIHELGGTGRSSQSARMRKLPRRLTVGALTRPSNLPNSRLGNIRLR